MLGKQESDLNDEIKVLLTFARGAKKRQYILQALTLAPKNCNQLAQELGSDWWTIQKHLKLLVEGALIKTVNFGRMKFYKITPKGGLALEMAFPKSEGIVQFKVTEKDQNKRQALSSV